MEVGSTVKIYFVKRYIVVYNISIRHRELPVRRNDKHWNFGGYNYDGTCFNEFYS